MNFILILIYLPLFGQVLPDYEYSELKPLATITKLEGVYSYEEEFKEIISDFISHNSNFNIGSILSLEKVQAASFSIGKVIIVKGSKGWLGVREGKRSILWSDKTIKESVKKKWGINIYKLNRVENNRFTTQNRIGRFSPYNGRVTLLSQELGGNVTSKQLGFDKKFGVELGVNNLLLIDNTRFVKLKDYGGTSNERIIEWEMDVPKDLDLINSDFSFHYNKFLFSTQKGKIGRLIKIENGFVEWNIEFPDYITIEKYSSYGNLVKTKNRFLQINYDTGNINWISDTISCKCYLDNTDLQRIKDDFFICKENEISMLYKLDLVNGKINIVGELPFGDYIGSSSGENIKILVGTKGIIKFDFTNDKILWKIRRSLKYINKESKILENGLVCFYLNERIRVIKFNEANGSVEWETDISNKNKCCNPLIPQIFKDGVILVR